MADKTQLVDIAGLEVFLEGVREETDYKIGQAGLGVTYTISKNAQGEIELKGSNGDLTKVTDKNTTYGFSQEGTTLTITPSEGDPITIALGEDITSAKIIDALGFTPADANNIPTALSALTDDATHRLVTDTEKSTWNAKYDKPTAGIAKTDLASDVQTSLGKADSALQSFTETDPTVPSHVKAIKESDITSWNNKSEFSGSYDDLTDIPTDLATLTDVNAKYTKPTTGIPKADLDYTVQTSLGKADTALQSYTEKYTGTVTSVKVGETSYSQTSGVVSLPAYPTTLPASDVQAWAKAANKPTYTASEVGALASTVTHLSGDIAATEKGSNNGVATLGSDGKVPSSQLPSYVDDVLEYNGKAKFPTTGETGKIYVDTSDNKTYRWGGTDYVEISPSLALGETSSTAYAGDKGKAVTDALTTHKADTTAHITATERTTWSGKQDALTTAQLSAANSGITSTKVSTYDGYATTIGNKVDKETGKGLSSNDFTSTYKTAIDNLPTSYAPTNAQANVIETVKVNNTALTVTDKTVNVTVPTKASDIGAMASTVTHLSGDVPTTRTVNGKALSDNITLSASDVGALASTTKIPSGAAADKGVDTSIAAASTSTNLPTSAAVAAFVEGKGYKTTDTNTTYTFAEGTTNGAFSVTPSGGSASSVKIHGLGSLAYSSATIPTITDTYSSTSSNGMSGKAVASAISGKADSSAIPTEETTNINFNTEWN